MELPFLSDPEVEEICRPLRQPAAQRRYLAHLGMKVGRKPNGRPLVARAEFIRAMVSSSAATGRGEDAGSPNREALVLMFDRRRRGAQAKK